MDPLPTDVCYKVVKKMSSLGRPTFKKLNNIIVVKSWTYKLIYLKTTPARTFRATIFLQNIKRNPRQVLGAAQGKFRL